MLDLLALAFIAVTAATVFLLGQALRWPPRLLFAIAAWCMGQAALASTGFYQTTDSFPPRFALLPLPALVAVVVLLLTRNGRALVDGAGLAHLTYLHTIRIAVELVLWQLAERGAVARLITFEGANFDILTGLTAPLVAYFVIDRGLLGRRWAVAWNLAGLLLLANVVVMAVLSLPTPFQRLSLEQPTVAVLTFPYAWLPCCVVPLVLFAHLAALRRLLAPPAVTAAG